MNLIKTYHFNIDLLREIYSPLIYLVRSDTYTNRLVIRLLNDGVIIEPKSYDIITLTVKKPDNTTCVSTGEYKNGVVVFDLDFQNVAVEGLCSCVIKVVSGDKSVTSMPFAYKVVNDPYEGTDKSIKSQSEFPVLNDLVKNVSGAIKELQNVETFYRNNETKFRNLADNYDILKSIYENKEEARELINSLQGLKKSIDGADEKQRNLEALIDRANILNGKITDNTVKMIDLISESDKKITSSENAVRELQTVLQSYENIKAEINSIADSINQLKKLLSDVNNSINTANTTKDSLNKSVGEANTTKTNLQATTTSANQIKSNLDTSINTANNSRANLDNSISGASTLQTDIYKAVNTANATKTAVEESTATANSTKTGLDNSTKTANSANTSLTNSINGSNTAKANLDTSIGQAGTAKTGLDDSIGKGTTLKQGIESDIGTATTLKSDLSKAVTNADTKKTELATQIQQAETTNTNLSNTDTKAKGTKTDLEKLLQDLNLTKGQVQEIIASGNLDQYVTDVKLQNELKAYAKKEILVNYKLEDGTIQNYNAIFDRNKNMNSNDVETCIVDMKINNESTKEYLVKTYKTKYYTAQVAYSLDSHFNIYKRKGLGDQWEDWEELQVAQSFDYYRLYLDQELQELAHKSEIPTKISQLANDKTFKTETEIQSMISNASKLKKEVVTSLPTTGSDDVIYLVQDPKGKDNNNYLEYLWISGKYELIGSTQVDLTGYATKTEIPTKVSQLNNDEQFLRYSQVSRTALYDTYTIVKDDFNLCFFKNGVAYFAAVPSSRNRDLTKNFPNGLGAYIVYTFFAGFKEINVPINSPSFQMVICLENGKMYQRNGVSKSDNLKGLQCEWKEWQEIKTPMPDISEFTQQELEEAFK